MISSGLSGSRGCACWRWYVGIKNKVEKRRKKRVMENGDMGWGGIRTVKKEGFSHWHKN